MPRPTSCRRADLRPALASYTDEELAALFEAFDVPWRYEHEDKSIAISLALVPELGERLEGLDPEKTTTGTMAGRRNPFIAGAGYEGVPTTAFRIVEVRNLADR